MKAYVLSLLLVFAWSQNLFADQGVISDLPEIGDSSAYPSQPAQPAQPSQPAQPTPPAPPAAPVAVNQPGSVRISSISRKSGGTLYRVQLKTVSSLQRMEVRVNAGQVQIHGTRLITLDNNEVQVRYLTNTDVVGPGARITSETLSQSDRVILIDLLMEAYGGEADVTVSVQADGRAPELVLAEVIPSNPTTPPPPPPSSPNNPPPPPAPPVNGEARLRAGDEVISLGGSSYYIGRVVEVYANGKVAVRDNDDGKTYIRSADVVLKKMQCESSKRLCIGDVVLTSGSANYTGRIVGAYSGGRVLVRDNDDGKVYLRTVENISKGVQCLDNKCVGERVISGSAGKYYSGRITAVWANGLFQVRDDDDGKDYFRRSETVLKSIRCERTKGICEGDRVLSGPFSGGSYYRGVVLGVYQGGIAAVRDDDDGRTYYRSAQALSKRVN